MVIAEKWPRRLFNKTHGYTKSKDEVYGLTPASAGRLRGTLAARRRVELETPVNGGRNYNGPKVAKFLVG